MTTFAELGLRDQVLRALDEMGYEEPTPIQARAIPALMQGRDVVAQALTGTGKTAAFGIALVERVDTGKAYPQALVLAPTRELAVQVAEELGRIGARRGLRVLPIYGGQPMDRQLRALRNGVHAIVATPGRLLDHIRRGTVDLGRVDMLVLDEADQMLQLGFQEDVEQIMTALAGARVTALFSATMPKPILDLVGRYMREPEMVTLTKPKELTVPETEQVYYEVPFPRKHDGLSRVLDARGAERVIVFCSTKRMVDEVAERLQGRGYVAAAIHGDISQQQRERVLGSFREGRTEVLVATDVAARGLDVPEVDLVVNFDIPPDPEYYVHRIGRTGRLGRKGAALTFVNPREMGELRLIERATGAHIRRAELPTHAEVEARDLRLLETQLLEVLSKDGYGRYRAVAEDVLEDRDPLDVAAAALALAAAKIARPAPRAESAATTARTATARAPEGARGGGARRTRDGGRGTPRRGPASRPGRRGRPSR